MINFIDKITALDLTISLKEVMTMNNIAIPNTPAKINMTVNIDEKTLVAIAGIAVVGWLIDEGIKRGRNIELTYNKLSLKIGEPTPTTA